MFLPFYFSKVLPVAENLCLVNKITQERLLGLRATIVATYDIIIGTVRYRIAKNNTDNNTIDNVTYRYLYRTVPYRTVRTFFITSFQTFYRERNRK